jgi:hypothetical protein
MPRPTDPVTERVRSTTDGLTALLAEAAAARAARSETGCTGAGATSETDSGAVCAWNHFENIPTFYNWNNRPR